MIECYRETLNGRPDVNTQEREHWDYEAGADSELRNAFRQSQMERRPDDSGKAAAAVADGLHVVCIDAPEYCRRTDAILGTRRIVDLITPDRAAAEARYAELCGEIDGSDLDPVLLPVPIPRPEPERAALTDDEIPF